MHRTDWMGTGPFGIMDHWLHGDVGPRYGATVTDLDAAVDRFDVRGLLRQVEESGADWLIHHLPHELLVVVTMGDFEAGGEHRTQASLSFRP